MKKKTKVILKKIGVWFMLLLMVGSMFSIVITAIMK